MLSLRAIYRHISIVLIAFSLMAPLLYSIQFYYGRMLHRMEMWREAEKGLLQTIELDSASIKWTKKNRELITNNAYFDVVSIAYCNGKAIVKGVFDNEETEMHEAFAASQDDENPKDHTTQRLAHWLQTLWVLNDVIHPTPSYFHDPLIHYEKITYLHPIGKKDPAFPPPWCTPASA